MSFKSSYCRYCSADPHDIRILEIGKYTVKCTNCGKMLFQIPASERTPYYYLKEITNKRRSGIRSINDR